MPKGQKDTNGMREALDKMRGLHAQKTIALNPNDIARGELAQMPGCAVALQRVIRNSLTCATCFFYTLVWPGENEGPEPIRQRLGASGWGEQLMTVGIQGNFRH